MSTPKKRQQSDSQHDKSNVLSLLQTIERIYRLCQDVLNTYTRTALILSLTIEAQMLLLKLRVMRERWQYHLPFKEACKVDFEEWGRKIEKMSRTFDVLENDDHSEEVTEYCPSKHFLLDLYDTLPEITEKDGYQPYYTETVTNRFLTIQEQMRRDMTEIWASYYKQHFSDHVIACLEKEEDLDLSVLRDDDESIVDACHDVLSDLSVELYKLSDLTEPDIQPEQFVRLAERVFNESDYNGQKARRSARQDVKTWSNNTPKRRRESTRREEIEASVKLISEMHYGRQLAEYIGEDYEIKGHFEGLGQFLHHVRKYIPVNDLADLMEQLYRIRYFRENKELEEVALAAKADAATTHDAADSGSPKIPQRPRFDYFFKKELSENADATRLFYDILHRVERYMNGRFTAEEKAQLDTMRYRQWKWNHLRVAFEKAGFIEKDTPKQYYAEYIVKVFPYTTAEAVKRSIQRYSEYADGFDDIVKEILEEFQSVQSMIET